jgi:sulfotransferase
VDKGVHFITGLPRSGSTLLGALLRQNPAVHAHITSPLGSLVGAMLHEMSQGNETAVFFDNRQRAHLLRGLFESYYADIHPSRTVFDTNRGWTARADLVAALFPQARIVCCVRHVPWIIDSVERLIRANRFELSKIFGFETGGTVYSRAEAMIGPGGLIGYPLNALKQAMHSAEAGRLLLLPYDTLVRRPAEAVAAVYAFTGLEPFDHDFERVSFSTTEFDARLGTPGLHDVRPKVEAVEREPVLPPDLWATYEGASIWRNADFNTKGVRVVGP